MATVLRAPISRPILLAAFLIILVFPWQPVQSRPLPSGGVPSQLAPSADLVIYDDGLQGWVDWSWESTINYQNSSPVHSGSASISVAYQNGWVGLSLHTDAAAPASQYTTLRFWIHGGSTGGQMLRVGANEDWSHMLAVNALANTWQEVDVPLSSMGSPASITRLTWQNNTAGSQPAFYLDDISLFNDGSTPTPTPPPGQGPALSVDASANRHAISPYIYGMNYTSEALAAELDLPVQRWGGNATTRYNWQNDTSNRGSDWYFENVAEDSLDPAQLPNGSTADQFVEQDLHTGTRTLLTLPIIGWTPKGRDTACGFSILKYGSQAGADWQWRPDCGNGIQSGGAFITSNDPHDTSMEITPAFDQAWINHLVSRYGTALNGGVMFYDLDNEPMLWNSTHRDVHPAPTSYDEMLNRTYAYAPAIKEADPSAQILGPVLWGWVAYFYSALDVAPGGGWYNHPQDRLAHQNIPFIEWYLQQMKIYEQQHSQRILDYVDVHYYPQGNGISLSSVGSADTQALRLRSTRSLWDSTYTDESWIADTVRLIPRMHAWVKDNYPGTRLAISEYNWGAFEDINGALAQADVLGIFGREGLDLATLWTAPNSSQPDAYAFRMFRNYDGQGAKFGDASLQAISGDQGQLAIYAAQRSSDEALTLMVINKNPASALTSTLSISNFEAEGSVQVYQYSQANLGSIVHPANLSLSNGSLTTAFPAYSITLLVLPHQLDPGPTPPPTGWKWLYMPLMRTK